VEAEEHNWSPTAWIWLLVASVMMLITTNLLLNYGITNSGGTLIDAVGQVLPYGLIAAIFLFYILRSNIRAYRLPRPALHGIHESPLRIVRNLFIIFGSIFLTVIFFYFLLQGFQVLGGKITTTAPPTLPSTSGSNPPEGATPVLDLWSSLSMLTVIITAATLIGAFLLGRRKEKIQETIDEGDLEDNKPFTPSFNSFVDDDDRSAILAYYAKGREHMADSGVPLTEATTPREFEKGVVNSVSAAAKDFSSLTRLFEEARFSVHNLGGSEREKARIHYEKVKRTTSVVRRS
jgi:hypothetical protein